MKKYSKYDNGNWREELRAAILKQAIIDWRDLCDGKHVYNSSLHEIAMFFIKDCNGMLNGLNICGEFILNILMQYKNAPPVDGLHIPKQYNYTFNGKKDKNVLKDKIY